ncbi:metalloregulator ArsR/SmtB family transcription factor [Clostridium bovifaecis]|uniref:Metalloregulator ArsR/SmtB family transcription factor n=1 Tax=Clostridium bovifaecis TaxID=2184719 RepID=A0A6I6ETG0_9CLOT|nr:metalloregulator ArsR/SmtB family transcription factor [Clostridium bovifaecis]
MEFIEIFKALGDENRIRILNILKEGELCVCEIESILGITQSNASRHLNKLKNLKIINAEKKAQWVYYSIDENFIEENKLLYDYLSEQLAKDNTYTKDIKMLKKYKCSSFTCEDLRECKEKIMNYLEGNHECKK